jgi:RTX calcium-binding nonapeptide repeat (4 copies)
MGMKRAVLLFAAMALALAVAGGVALAADIECPNRQDGTCVGTPNDDRITGTPDPDFIRARGGDDVLSARRGEGGDFGGDFSIGGAGEDKVRGQGDPDQVVGGSISGDFATGDLTFADNHDDVVRGGPGDDPTVAGGFGRGGKDRLYGEEGNDTMVAAQRGFPFRGDVRVNQEIVDCGPGQEDIAYYDRGVDVVKDNCETKIARFPDVGAGASSREGSGGGLFEGGSE